MSLWLSAACRHPGSLGARRPQQLLPARGPCASGHAGAPRGFTTPSSSQRCRRRTPMPPIAAQGDDSEPKSPGGDDGPAVPPSTESLFMQELRRRGVGSMDSLDDADSSSTSSSSSAQPTNPFTIKGTPSTPFGGSQGGGAAASPADLEDQLEKSRKLNSEGLEGLIPRGKELLKLGGSQFLAFLPFMGAGVVLFVGCYYILGSSFIHGGTIASGPPPYVDPYLLLEEPTVDPMIPLR